MVVNRFFNVKTLKGASALRTSDTLVTCLTLDSEPDIVRDDGGGGHLALVLAAVSPGSRPEYGHGHNTVVTLVTTLQ